MARQDILNATLTGTLVRDPEEIAGGKGAKFSIASNESWRNKDTQEFEEYANFFDIVVWGGAAKPVLSFCTKGKRVAIVARPKQERWENKETGKTQSRVTFHASSVLFLDNKSDTGSGSSSGDTFTGGGGQEDDDIPF